MSLVPERCSTETGCNITTNIRPGWKSLPEINTLPYLENPLLMNAHFKLECLSLEGLHGLVQCLWARPGAYPRTEHLQGASLKVGSGNSQTLD
jgi:hypothetical protein